MSLSLELAGLVSLVCLAGNGGGCTQASKAYYRYNQYDIIVKNIERRHQELAVIVIIGSVIVKRKAILPLYNSNNFKSKMVVEENYQGMLLTKDF